MNCDVAVVGAGPAGASAARVIAAAGLHVRILEKAAIPRYKTCGGGITGRAMKLLAASLVSESPSSIVESVCHSAEFVLSPNLHFAARRDEPIVVMTMRDRFDEWLTHKAIHAGATLHTNCAVRDVSFDRGEVRLDTNQGEIHSRFVVAADGANSVIAKKAGWRDHRHLAPALEYEVAVSPADLARWNQSARFDFHVVPKGYAWVFPKKSHLSMGVMTFDGHVANLNHCFEKYLHYLGISPHSCQRHGYVIPISPRDRILARDSIFLVGDAAGLADPITAEGIGYAIQSGQLAGRAIIESFNQPRRALALYNRMIDRQIIPELRWARRLASLMYAMPKSRDMLFRFKGQRLTDLMADVICGGLQYSRLMTSPANYLKLVAGSW